MQALKKFGFKTLFSDNKICVSLVGGLGACLIANAPQAFNTTFDGLLELRVLTGALSFVAITHSVLGYWLDPSATHRDWILEFGL